MSIYLYFIVFSIYYCSMIVISFLDVSFYCYFCLLTYMFVFFCVCSSFFYFCLFVCFFSYLFVCFWIIDFAFHWLHSYLSVLYLFIYLYFYMFFYLPIYHLICQCYSSYLFVSMGDGAPNKSKRLFSKGQLLAQHSQLRSAKPWEIIYYYSCYKMYSYKYCKFLLKIVNFCCCYFAKSQPGGCPSPRYQNCHPAEAKHKGVYRAMVNPWTSSMVYRQRPRSWEHP